MRATLLILAGIAAAACGVITAPAALAQTQSAELTIATLEASDVKVNVNRIGSAPLNECVLTDIGKVRTRKEFIRRGDDLIQVVHRSVNVTADCSRSALA